MTSCRLNDFVPLHMIIGDVGFYCFDCATSMSHIHSRNSFWVAKQVGVHYGSRCAVVTRSGKTWLRLVVVGVLSPGQ